VAGEILPCLLRETFEQSPSGVLTLMKQHFNYSKIRD